MFALTTKRMVLRDVMPEDAAPLHQLRSDPLVTRYCGYLVAEQQEQTEAWLRQTIQDNARVPRQEYYLAMVRRADGCVMGWFSIGRAREPAYGELSFGYALRPPYWGQGCMTEALMEALAYAFDDLGAGSVYGECDAANMASARVMEKAGLRLVDRVPEPDGSESLYYRVTAEEWRRREGYPGIPSAREP